MKQEGRGSSLAEHPTGHYIVCGANALANRLIEELVDQYEVPVVAVVPDRTAEHAPRIEALPNVVVHEYPTVTEEALLAAGIAEARGVALLDGTDQQKIHAALAAQAHNESVRIVLRMFNPRLGEHIQQLLPNSAALSGSATAAPAFANSALGRPNSVQVGERYLHIAVDEQINEHLVCLVADQIDRKNLGRLRLLPYTGSQAQDFIALADRTASDGPIEIRRAARTDESAETDEEADGAAEAEDGAEAEEHEPSGVAALQALTREPPVRIPWWNHPLWWAQDALRYFTSARLRLAMLIALVALLASAWELWHHFDHNMGWAAYLTLMDLAGSGQPDQPGQPSLGGLGTRLAQVVITFCGIALVPVVTAIVIDTVASGRRGLVKAPSARTRDHVVVVGLGNVGTRVAALVHETGVPVVCIERDPQARGIAEVRALGLPVLVGDARLEAQLRQARIQHSRALIAVTSDDAANLQSALEARAARPDIRVVLRLFDDDFAQRVYATLPNTASRSVSYLAAPAFAAALMGREVLGTLSVFRHVLLLAELTADEQSGLLGKNMHDIEDAGGVRVIAVRLARRPEDYQWNYRDLSRRLEPGDRIVVAASRSGLARIHNPLTAAAPGAVPAQSGAAGSGAAAAGVTPR